jgi:hypothetical protein
MGKKDLLRDVVGLLLPTRPRSAHIQVTLKDVTHGKAIGGNACSANIEHRRLDVRPTDAMKMAGVVGPNNSIGTLLWPSPISRINAWQQ